MIDSDHIWKVRGFTLAKLSKVAALSTKEASAHYSCHSGCHLMKKKFFPVLITWFLYLSVLPNTELCYSIWLGRDSENARFYFSKNPFSLLYKEQKHSILYLYCSKSFQIQILKMTVFPLVITMVPLSITVVPRLCSAMPCSLLFHCFCFLLTPYSRQEV